MRILNAGVQTKTTGRRKTMGAVADQEHPALPKRFGDLHADAPDRAVEQRYTEVRNPDVPTRDFDELLIRPGPLAVVLGHSDLRHRQPAIPAIGVENARARQAGLIGDDHEA